METKLTLGSFIFVLLLSACNSQDATVTATGPTGANTGSAQNPVIVSKNVKPSRLSIDTSTVFLTLATTDIRGTPVGVDGLAFLPAGALDQRPLSYHFQNRGLPYNSTVYVPTSKGVLCASRSGIRQGSLNLFDPQTRQVRSIGRFPTLAIASLAATDGLEFIAWSDIKGNAWVMNQDTNKPLQLNLSGMAAKTVQLSPATREILVSGTLANNPHFQIFSLDSLNVATLSLQGDGARMNPRGNKVAFIQADSKGAGLFILDRASKTSIQNGTTDERIREATWKNDLELAYRSTTADGTTSLHELSLDAGTDTTITLLHMSDGLAADQNVVCPAWAPSGNLYFADLGNSGFSIFQARFDGASWIVRPFANTNNSENTGLICPQLFSGSTI